MDSNSLYTELETQLKHFIAENESLKAQLSEYCYIIDVRDQEIDALRRKLSELTESQSRTENQSGELLILQEYIDQLKNQMRGASDRESDLEKQLGFSVSTEHRMDDLKQEYTHLQTQLADFQDQLQDLTNRNLLLQQQTSQIAELESMLENVLRERDELKEKLQASLEDSK